MLLYMLHWFMWPNLIQANIDPSCLSTQSFCHSVNEVVWQSGTIKSRAGVAIPTLRQLPYLFKRQRFSFIELRIPLAVKAICVWSTTAYSTSNSVEDRPNVFGCVLPLQVESAFRVFRMLYTSTKMWGEKNYKWSQSLSDYKCFSVLDSVFSVDVFSCHGVIVFPNTGFVFLDIMSFLLNYICKMCIFLGSTVFPWIDILVIFLIIDYWEIIFIYALGRKNSELIQTDYTVCCVACFHTFVLMCGLFVLAIFDRVMLLNWVSVRSFKILHTRTVNTVSWLENVF